MAKCSILFLSRNSSFFVTIVTNCVNERLNLFYDRILASVGRFTPKERKDTFAFVRQDSRLRKFEVRNFHFTSSLWKCYVSLSLQVSTDSVGSNNFVIITVLQNIFFIIIELLVKILTAAKN